MEMYIVHAWMDEFDNTKQVQIVEYNKDFLPGSLNAMKTKPGRKKL